MGTERFSLPHPKKNDRIVEWRLLRHFSEQTRKLAGGKPISDYRFVTESGFTFKRVYTIEEARKFVKEHNHPLTLDEFLHLKRGISI